MLDVAVAADLFVRGDAVLARHRSHQLLLSVEIISTGGLWTVVFLWPVWLIPCQSENYQSVRLYP
jgi:hypothetical protein